MRAGRALESLLTYSLRFRRDKCAARSLLPSDSGTGTLSRNRKSHPSELSQELAGLDHRGYLSSILGPAQILLSIIPGRTRPPGLWPTRAHFRSSQSPRRRSIPDEAVSPRPVLELLDADLLPLLPPGGDRPYEFKIHPFIRFYRKRSRLV